MAKVLHFQSILERSNEPESCFYLALRMCTYVKKNAGKQPLSYTESKKTCNFYKAFKQQH